MAWITQFNCNYLLSVHQIAPPQTEVADIFAAYYSIIYRPGLLTYSGRFTT